MKHLLFILLVIYIPLISFSQGKEGENQLALLYYSQGEYAKAADSYLTLFNQTHSQIHFDYLIACYQELNKFEKAEKITKEQINRYPKSYYYQIKLATIYSSQGNIKDANDIYDKTIKKSSKQLETIISAGQACLDNKVDSVARIIFENGHSKYPDNTIIVKSLGSIYLHSQDYEKLIDSYLTLLQNNEDELSFIEEQLQYSIFDNSNKKLKNTLQNRLENQLEKKQNNLAIKELYLWLQLQDKNFEKAFSIAKEIDNKKDEDGTHVYDVGKIALTNYDYQTATKCFTQVVTFGPMGDLYEPALKNLLETSYNKLFNSNIQPNQQEIIDLENEYIKALSEIYDSKSKTELIKSLAHIEAFYLNKSSNAIEMLKNAISDLNLRSYKSILEMELADIYTYINDIWGANLLYASLALNYKNNDIGHEAQLKQARIAYFNGNFAYAQALLDVLKGSTSKLIANDAFELAQLISDNTALDTTTNALEIFARGDLLILQRKTNEAINCYDSIPKLFPGHSLEDEILMRKAEIAKTVNDYNNMVTYLQEIENRFSYEIFADKAIFYLAKYFDQNNDINKAKEKYKKIIFEYPNSIYASQARKRYREFEE